MKRYLNSSLYLPSQEHGSLNGSAGAWLHHGAPLLHGDHLYHHHHHHNHCYSHHHQQITRCPPLSTRSASTSSSSSTGSSAPSPPSSSSSSSQRLAARLCSNSAPSTRAGWKIQRQENTNTQIYKDYPLTLVHLLEQLWRELFLSKSQNSQL